MLLSAKIYEVHYYFDDYSDYVSGDLGAYYDCYLDMVESFHLVVDFEFA